MTVGWIDGLADGAQLGSRCAAAAADGPKPHEAPRAFPDLRPACRVPFDLPAGVLNPAVIRLFNAAYYRRFSARATQSIVSPESFLYPLDAIGSWNRGYGRRGFVQYQCVLPETGVRQSVRAFMELVASHGRASFLSVIKDCGPEGIGTLSFPMPGISIAIDIPYDGSDADAGRPDEPARDRAGRTRLSGEGCA